MSLLLRHEYRQTIFQVCVNIPACYSYPLDSTQIQTKTFSGSAFASRIFEVKLLF